MSAPPLSLKLVAAAALALAADSAPELTVLRVVPSEVASPGTVVTVTFDRPVAGSLDRTVALRAAGGPAGAPVRWTMAARRTAAAAGRSSPAGIASGPSRLPATRPR